LLVSSLSVESNCKSLFAFGQASMESIRDSLAEELVKMTAEVCIALRV